MKFLIIALLMISQAVAQDMSSHEDYDSAYIERGGYLFYVGQCSLHEDYLDRLYYLSTSIISHNLESYQSSEDEIQQLFSKMPAKLLEAVKEHIFDGERWVFDDISLSEVSYNLQSNYRLYQFNIGVGGGNGMYLFYLETSEGYELVAHTFDGDLISCDKKVWLE